MNEWAELAPVITAAAALIAALTSIAALIISAISRRASEEGRRAAKEGVEIVNRLEIQLNGHLAKVMKLAEDASFAKGQKDQREHPEQGE